MSSSSRRGATAATLAGVLSCVPVEELAGPPEGIAFWAGIIEQAPFPRVSALSPRDRPLDGASSEEPILLGWRASSLPQLPADFASAPLELARGCAPRLPEADWSSVPTRTFELTAPWLECTAATVAAELRCDGIGQDCSFDVRGDGCRFFLSSCPAFRRDFSVELGAHGSVCLLDAVADCSETRGEELGALTCKELTGTCRIELYSVPERPPFQEESRLTLAPKVEVPDLEAAYPEALFYPTLKEAGALSDLAAVGDRAVVLVQDLETSWSRRACRGTQLIAIDSRTGQRVGGSTTADCLDQLVPDPSGGSLLALGRTSLVRVSLSGRITETIAELPFAPGFSIDLVAIPGHIVAAVSDESVTCEPTRVAELDTSTTEWHDLPLPSGNSSCPRNRVAGLGIASDAEVVAPTDDTEELVRFRFPSREASSTTLRAGFGPTYFRGHRPQLIEATGALALPSLGQRTTVAVVSDRVLAQVESFERRGNITALTPTTDPGKLVFAGYWAGKSFVGLFDGESVGFKTGLLELGFGPVSRLVSDGQRGYWALMPWAGELVHFVPTEGP